MRAGYAGGETSHRSIPRVSSNISSKDFRRRGDRGAGKISPPRWQQVVAKTAVKHVIVGSMGDLLGFKGRDRQSGDPQGQEDGAGL